MQEDRVPGFRGQQNYTSLVQRNRKAERPQALEPETRCESRVRVKHLGWTSEGPDAQRQLSHSVKIDRTSVNGY